MASTELLTPKRSQNVNPELRAAAEALRARRRKLVGDMVIGGRTYREMQRILRELKDGPIRVSLGTIKSDVDWVRDQWRENAARPPQEKIDLEEAKLDTLERGYWAAAMGGDVQSGRMILAISARRAMLLGLDKPTKSEVKITAGMDMEEFEEQLERDLDKALGLIEGEAAKRALEGVLDVESTVVNDGDATEPRDERG